MTFYEDDAAAICRGEFSTAAVLDNRTIRGIFRNAYELQLTTEPGVMSRTPSIECADDDVEAVSQGDAIRIGSTVYTVTAMEPTGTGTTRLVLSKD